MSISAIIVMTTSFVLVISLTTYSLYKTIAVDLAEREKNEKK